MQNLKEEIKLNAYQDTYPNIYGYKWINYNLNHKGVILIVHGMSEHANRYDELGKILAENGFIVYGFDLIGHGKSCFENLGVGVIPNNDFCNEIIKCVNQIYHYIKQSHKEHEINLFAHSMGSMIMQRYIELYPNHFSKVILSGTDLGGAKYKMLNTITKRIIKKQGINTYSKLVNKLTLDGFNSKFKKEQVPLGWLSENEDNRKQYLNDPYCNHQYPASYYYSLSKLLVEAIKKNNLNKISVQKILLISGKSDPVTSFSKAVKRLSKKYSKVNVNSSFIIIDDARHEWHNEIRKIEYFEKYVIPFYN